MGNPLGTQADKSLEGESFCISAFIALDGSSNVIGFAPTGAPFSLAGPFTRAKGLQKAIGPAGAIVTQPHLSAGVYSFTLDEPWWSGTEAWVQQIDPGAVASLNAYIDANVTSGTGLGYFPGQEPALAAQTIRVRFRSTTGVLTDPTASTGFYMGLKLKRNPTL